MKYPTIDGITSSSIPYYYEDETCYVLLGKRKETSGAYPGFWCLVGGFLNPGVETLEQCCIRELEEETGFVVDIKDVRLVTTQSSPTRDPRGHIIDTVWCICFEGPVKAVAADDLADVGWFPIEEALSMNLAFDHEESLYLFGTMEGVV